MAAKKKAALNGKAEKAEQASPTTEAKVAAPPRDGRFVIGGKPGPGRPKGSRNKLAEEFITDFYNDWLEHGASVIALVRAEKPDVYFKGAVAILPKQVDMRVSPFAELTEDTLDARMAALAKELGQAIAILQPGRTERAN
jgi:hypothetical protein